MEVKSFITIGALNVLPSLCHTVTQPFAKSYCENRFNDSDKKKENRDSISKSQK